MNNPMIFTLKNLFRNCRIILWMLPILCISVARAQEPQNVPEITVFSIRNLSNSLPSSVDPLLIADKTGAVHLFWSEDVNGRASLGGTTSGNTIIYSRWDGVNWSAPADILLTPTDGINLSFGDPKAWQPEGIIDEQGRIHLIWLGQYPDKLYYSFSPAASAGSASSWSTPVVLANDSTGSQYSIDIEYVAPEYLHIVYARVHWETQYAGDQPRSLNYLKSEDGGSTWSEPQELSVVPDPDRGYSNVRLLKAPEARLFASWTEWDLTGNGQAVYVARSLDNGNNWNDPVKLSERESIDYERDWMKLAWLEGDRLVAVWEGGFRAYRQFMYSDDNGLTWSEAEDRFYWLIGDNGFPEFVRDGANNLHFFVAQRVREGSIGRAGSLGLWHSVWLGGTKWTDAELVGGGNDMVFISVEVVGGNNLVAAWYASSHGEIMVMNGKIEGAPAIPAEPWPTNLETPPTLPTQISNFDTQLLPTPLPQIENQISEELSQINTPSSFNIGSPILLGLIPTALILMCVGFIRYLIRSYRT